MLTYPPIDFDPIGQVNPNRIKLIAYWCFALVTQNPGAHWCYYRPRAKRSAKYARKPPTLSRSDVDLSSYQGTHSHLNVAFSTFLWGRVPRSAIRTNLSGQ